MRWILPLFLFSVLFAAELKKTDIQLGNQILTVEIADTLENQAKGLMGRKSLPENQGMLFVNKKPAILSFWMKNTWIPLSIGFFDADQKLINTANMDPPVSSDFLPTYKSLAPAVYALEVPQGWFLKNQIEPGAKFTFLDRKK